MNHPVFALFVLAPLAYVSADSPAPAHRWALDSTSGPGIVVRGGTATMAPGVDGGALALDGNVVVEATDSENLEDNHGDNQEGFSFSIWLNPYSIERGQQMVAAKNRYSLNERQWGVMIDKDGRFRLYVWQGKWVTVHAEVLPKLGAWHLLGVVVEPRKAELWVNGKRAGHVALEKPVPNTAAPLTFGGVNHNGRIWQTLFGALDDACLFDRPLAPEEMAALYTAVSATHEIPTEPPIDTGFPIWNASRRIGKAAELPKLENVSFHVIKKWEPGRDGYRWLHGVALAWHADKLYAAYGHNTGRENTVTEEGRYSVSVDGGVTWSDARTIDTGTDAADLAVSHGVFLSHAGSLWAFLGAFHATRKKVHTRAYVLDDETGEWIKKGVVVGDGFWPMTEPVRMGDGNWIMPGLHVGSGNPAAVAISRGDDLTQWEQVVIPRGRRVGNLWGESTVFVEGPRIINIARYGAEAIALTAMSRDYGRSWTPSRTSNLPMVTSKPCAGILSTGQRYLIATTTVDSGKRRYPLTIAVSRPGERVLSKVFVIRDAVFPGGPGESHETAALSYPYAVEHAGRLYVGYSNDGGRGGNHNSAELAIIPVAALRIE